MSSFSITLQQIGKRFGRQWLFQNVSVLMKQGNTYALTGNNGSGKSTLLQVIYGYQSPTKGALLVKDTADTEVAAASLYKHISFVAPYTELPEEFTLREQLSFHFSFKPIAPGFDIQSVIDAIWLNESADKKIKHFSSGMRQRVKLAQAFYADTPALLLDEPCTNLDKRGIEWYHDTLKTQKQKKLVVIASNQLYEYELADSVIDLNSYINA
jgi:ABC-type multidrug transport system ATPase subunit